MVERGTKWQYFAAGQVDIYCEQTDRVTRILAETEPLFTHCFNYNSPFDSLGFCYGLWGQESPVSQTSTIFGSENKPYQYGMIESVNITASIFMEDRKSVV